MTKYFCDRCGEEITESNGRQPASSTLYGARLTRHLDGIGIQVMIQYEGVWNAGVICKQCVLYVVANGIDA